MNDTDVVEKGIADGITQRLNDIISKGDAADVARRAGVPYPSLLKYLSGRQMRPAALVAIARATGVTAGWLLTGEGPMRDGEVTPAPDRPAPAPRDPPAPAACPQRLFSLINADRLGAAYAAALQALAARGQHGATPRRVMQVTVLIYDGLTEAEENPALAADDPQDDPQNAPQGAVAKAGELP